MARTRSIVCKVSELQPFDKILSGSVLGSLSATETLSVKTNEPAANGKFALTIHNVGTIFVNGSMLIEVLPSDDDYDDDEDDD